jgi:hypothetical protein
MELLVCPPPRNETPQGRPRQRAFDLARPEQEHWRAEQHGRWRMVSPALARVAMLFNAGEEVRVIAVLVLSIVVEREYIVHPAPEAMRPTFGRGLRLDFARELGHDLLFTV